MKVALRCPVRGCPSTLAREGIRWVCDLGHSFDQHRSGSLNLLQPQDRRSRHPGDSREAATARRRLAAASHAAGVHRALSDVIEARRSGDTATVLDVGCGEGSFLGQLRASSDLERHGVDISAPAIDLAAKAFPDPFFVVANADRALPYVDGAFDFVTSIDARLHATAFARCLKPHGFLLVAIPAPDDLEELRERVQGRRLEKPRAARAEAELASSFALIDRAQVRDQRALEPSTLRDLLITTYRGFRESERHAVESLTTMTVTMSHDLLLFKRL